jgi:phenol 2-monooxygenase
VFRERGVSRDGAVVVVRPDMYVAAVLPLSARQELTDFFARHMLAPAPSTRPAPIRTVHERIRI